MKQFFIDLFKYNLDTNHRLFELVNEAGGVSDQTQLLCGHILSAHDIWNHRIMSKDPNFPVWPEIQTSHYLDINQRNYSDSMQILDQYKLDANVAYKNSKGEPFKNTVQVILFQIINHSNYHRAQIARDMKENDVTPLTTDYIFYKR